MQRLAIGGAVLALLLASVGGAQAERPPQAQQFAQKAEPKARKAEPLPVAVVGGVELKESPATEKGEKAREEREKSDLQAQWYAAAGSLTQALLGAIGLVGLGFTVFYARRAWREAASANQQAREFFAAEHRPWISVDGKVVRRAESGSDVDVSIKLTCKNIGRSVATNVGVKLYQGGQAFSLDVLIAGMKAEMEGRRSLPPVFGHTLFPDEEWENKNDWSGSMVDPAGETFEPFIGGWASYWFTGSTEEHFTPFVWCLSAKGWAVLEGGVYVPKPEGILRRAMQQIAPD